MPARRDISVDETLPDEHAHDAVASAPERSLPHLFVVLECDRPESGVARHSLANVDRVVLGRGAERSSARSFEDRSRALAVSIPDLRMSSRHAVIEHDGADFILRDLGSRNGTRVNGELAEGPVPLADGNLIQTGHTLLRYRGAISVPVGEPADVDLGREGIPNLLARDPRALRAQRRIRRHQLRRDAGAPRRGAALRPPTRCVLGSGARRIGLLRSADGGTLLLDEIGDLPSAAAQSALLRVLQEREVLPLGAVRSIPVDLRVIAATHKPLDALVARDQFRSDLYARLAG